MATTAIVPQQPGLNSFIVYDRLPEGCISFEMIDDSQAPHLRKGDFVVVDTTDRAPMNGEMMLATWARGRQSVAEIRNFPDPENIMGYDGQTRYFNAYWQNALYDFGGQYQRSVRWFDGPYPERYLEEMITGRVVGVYQPDFRTAIKELA